MMPHFKPINQFEEGEEFFINKADVFKTTKMKTHYILEGVKAYEKTSHPAYIKAKLKKIYPSFTELHVDCDGDPNVKDCAIPFDFAGPTPDFYLVRYENEEKVSPFLKDLPLGSSCYISGQRFVFHKGRVGFAKYDTYSNVATDDYPHQIFHHSHTAPDLWKASINKKMFYNAYQADLTSPESDNIWFDEVIWR